MSCMRVRAAARLRRSNLLGDPGFGPLLDAQLHQAHAERREPLHPGGAVDDRVDAWQLHPRNARADTGVEGCAMSRGSMGPAVRAA